MNRCVLVVSSRKMIDRSSESPYPMRSRTAVVVAAVDYLLGGRVRVKVVRRREKEREGERRREKKKQFSFELSWVCSRIVDFRILFRAIVILDKKFSYFYLEIPTAKIGLLKLR